jgi:hypothetical protein
VATFQVVDEFANFLGKKRDDLSADTFKAVLTDVAPTKAGTQVLADITQIANGNGYVTDGVTLTGVAWAETGGGTGIWAFTSSAFLWTASGGSIAQFRYVAIYDSTSTNKDVVGYLDYGSEVNVTVGNSFTVTPGANGIMRATVS